MCSHPVVMSVLPPVEADKAGGFECQSHVVLKGAGRGTVHAANGATGERAWPRRGANRQPETFIAMSEIGGRMSLRHMNARLFLGHTPKAAIWAPVDLQRRWGAGLRSPP